MIFQKIESTHREKLSLATLTILGLIFYLIRLPNLAFIENSLWAEDSSIFFNTALHNGASSLFIPYNGYFHLYPRICAFLASLISIKFTPYLYFFASLIPSGFLAYAVAKRLQENRIGYLVSFLAILFIFVQPNNGEVLYNITNSQWLICVAMTIWVLLSNNPKSSIFELIILTIAFLTSPFSILIIPAIILKIIFEDKQKLNLKLYIILFICAAIQFALVLSSARIASKVGDRNLYHWAQAIFTAFSFGMWPKMKIWSFTLLPLWVMVFSSFFSFKNYPRFLKPALLLLTAIISFGTTLVARRDLVSILNPYTSGSRYYFSLYALMIVCIFMLSARSIYKNIIVFISLTIACSLPVFKGFLPFKTMENMHWMAYYAFAEKIPGIPIPINPVWVAYPPWHIEIPKKLVLANKNHEIIVTQTDPNRLVNLHAHGHYHYDPTNHHASLFYSVPRRCKEKKFLAFSAKIEKQKPGVVRFFWKENLDYDERHMNWRYLVSGKTDIFFAIPNTHSEEFRLDLIDDLNLIDENTRKKSLPYSISKPEILCTN